jgi:hypothetical protein
VAPEGVDDSHEPGGGRSSSSHRGARRASSGSRGADGSCGDARMNSAPDSALWRGPLGSTRVTPAECRSRNIVVRRGLQRTRDQRTPRRPRVSRRRSSRARAARATRAQQSDRAPASRGPRGHWALGGLAVGGHPRRGLGEPAFAASSPNLLVRPGIAMQGGPTCPTGQQHNASCAGLRRSRAFFARATRSSAARAVRGPA